jgi:L-lactate dehydrogenase complex protein LldG
MVTRRGRARGVRRGEDLVRRFRERAEAVGAEVRTAEGPAGARNAVASVVKETGAATVAVAADALAFVPSSLKVRIARGNGAEEIAAAGAGVVRAHHGIAETGALVHLDRSDAEKNVWTLPPVCIALLEAGRIVERLEDVLSVLSRQLADPSGFGQASLVTGPSRTADIENVLSIGVHGPGRLVVVLVGTAKGTR